MIVGITAPREAQKKVGPTGSGRDEACTFCSQILQLLREQSCGCCGVIATDFREVLTQLRKVCRQYPKGRRCVRL